MQCTTEPTTKVAFNASLHSKRAPARSQHGHLDLKATHARQNRASGITNQKARRAHARGGGGPTSFTRNGAYVLEGLTSEASHLLKPTKYSAVGVAATADRKVAAGAEALVKEAGRKLEAV